MLVDIQDAGDSANTSPRFTLLGASAIRQLLAGREADLVEVVRTAYLALDAGAAVNPPSSFLRFPDRPANRIIALPASLTDPVPVDGLKWISSVPGNHARGLPRASAVLVLNDPVTGFPLACLEGSLISAARTAASAALAADLLHATRSRPDTVAYVGAGVIARHVHRYLRGCGWLFARVQVHDIDRDAATRFAGELAAGGEPAEAIPDVRTAIAGAGLVVFATTAGEPYIHEPGLLAHGPVVLHLSLRDLAPAVLLEADNVVDDVAHCLREQTSPHLTEQLTGDRSFITATLADVLTGRHTPAPAGRTVVCSPFGLGVLDLAVGRRVYDLARVEGRLVELPDFFASVG